MRNIRFYLLTSAALVVAHSVSGCQTTRNSNNTETTGSISYAAPANRTDAEWRQDVTAWGERYRNDPKNPEAAVRYAQALRNTGQRSQATAVLEQSAIHNTKNIAVLGAYGRALADTGNHQQALEVLNRAHTPDQPDWRILSAQGAVLDQMGRHDDARSYYLSALKIVPNEPSVLSNLGLSYVLSKDLPRAEETLRQANQQPNAEPRVRQNLALVVGLQGRFQDAEGIAKADLPPDQAQANVAYLKQMLAEERTGQKVKRPSKALRQAARVD